MLRFILILAVIPFLTISYCAPLTCYHCFESFDKALRLENLSGENFETKFVRCDKNKNKWNTLKCPVQWPICVIMNGTVENHSEIIRTCAQRDFCSKYVPPVGVKLDHCRECNTSLCNDYVKVPDDPPVKPEPSGPVFTFNINIDLNLNKSTVSEDSIRNAK